MNVKLVIGDLLSRNTIEKRAKARWDSKSEPERIRASSKYRHVFEKFKLSHNSWNGSFDSLKRAQRNILMKGELIRTYDALSNKQKTEIKKKFGLSTFSSKWFRLPSNDKKKLLELVLSDV